MTMVAPKKTKGRATSTSRPRSQPRQPIELPEGMWDRIAKKAYELWEQRGRRDGRAMEDWLDAEAMVMEEIHEARE
jgi:hypothetical protein